jgi:hypothetical protein
VKGSEKMNKNKQEKELKEEKDEVPEILYKTKTKVDFPGCNLSFMIDPKTPEQFLATVRQITKYPVLKEEEEEETYPTCHSRVLFLVLGSSFQVLQHKELLEKNPRTRYLSFTTGIEDCRFISENYMSAVCLDTNENWQPEMCLCHIHDSSLELIPLLLQGDDSPQKNWLFLDQTEYSMNMIHSYNPLQIVSVEKTTGISKIIHLRKLFNISDFEVHGGACVYLEKEKIFLVLVRLSRNHVYCGSMWFIMNKQYKLLGLSPVFFFDKTFQYEMCMSLVPKNNSIFASVSFDDEHMYIYEFSLDSIFSSMMDM